MVASPVAVEGAPKRARAGRDRQRRTRLRHGAGVLASNRLRRALLRQTPVALLCFLALTGLGAATWLMGALSLRQAVEFFVPSAAVTGLIVAAVLELGRNTVTSISSLGKHPDFQVLGAAPRLTAQALRSLPPDQRSPLGSIVFMPASPFASAFRELEQALAHDNVVAFIAPIAGEGASTAAVCAAVSAVQQGRRVILVDCDIRHRSFSAALEQAPDSGVLEACEHPDDWRQFIDEEVESGLHFLPVARPATPWRTLAGSAGLPQLLDRLRAAYDLVVLDCPPALHSADGPFVARLADRAVVVAGWDTTPLSALRECIRQLRVRGRTRTSVFMNRVPPAYRFSQLDPTA